MAVFKFRNLNTGQAMPVPEGEFTVGREDDCYVHVEDASISRRHAQLFNQLDGFFLEDLGSVNGTVAHGAYITGRVKIDFGDVINLGSVPFRVDPEVPGEIHEEPADVIPKRTRQFRHATERIPARGEKSRVVETIAPERLSAPAVNPNDADAEALNAITMREPEVPEPMRLPSVRPGLTPLPQRNLVKPASPPPTLSPPSQLTPPRPPSAQGQRISRKILHSVPQNHPSLNGKAPYRSKELQSSPPVN